MPAAIPIVATVAAGAAAIGGYTTIALAITIAAQVSTQLLTKKPSLGSYRDSSERKQVLRAAASPKTVVYGRTVSAGTLFFSEEEKGDQTDGEWLHLAITLAGHSLSGVGTIYLGDDDIGSYPDNATYEVHNDRQTADPFMLQNCPSWKSDMIGKGISWLRVSLKFNAEKFPSGIPNIKVEKSGRKVYDPRTGRTEYSNNLALCVLDYYRNYLKVPDADINWDQFQEAANICDETVTNGDGTSEKRYTLNGEFDLSENKASILEAMLTAGAAEPTYIAGKHGILVGAYYGPATEVITESQLAGDIEIMPEVAQSERVNTINGTFIDPKQVYSEVDFPSVSVTEWVAEDGVEISQDLKLRFVTSEFQAQRLADIKLKRTRISRTMNLTLNLSGYRYRPGMYVKVNFPSLGIINVEMRVTDWKFGVQNGVQLTLKQETADVWGDAIGKPIERPPFTQLPSGGVAQPQNLKYTVEEIGQVVQGVLSWQNIGQFV
ncbi:phage tail protein, partial [Enterobacter hormaechei]|uniref:phage tail protein n=1 Tax=Enterobacter hormaechei TaxID=158836 RepID=UPI003F65D3C6